MISTDNAQIIQDLRLFKKDYVTEKNGVSYNYLKRRYEMYFNNNPWNYEKIKYVKANYRRLGENELVRRMGRKHKRNIQTIIQQQEMVNKTHDWYDDKTIYQACIRFFKIPDNKWESTSNYKEKSITVN